MRQDAAANFGVSLRGVIIQPGVEISTHHIHWDTVIGDSLGAVLKLFDIVGAEVAGERLRAGIIRRLGITSGNQKARKQNNQKTAKNS